MLKTKLGLLIFSMLLALGYNGQYGGSYDVSELDKKLRYMVTENDFYGKMSEEQKEAYESSVQIENNNARTDDHDIWEDDGTPSEMTVFSESFRNMSYGDVIGHLEMEIVDLDCDIIYAEDYADAKERCKKNKGCVYLYNTQDGDGLNASYIGLYADLSLMQTYEQMEDLGSVDGRYIHLWIEAGGERLQMDILGAYYSEDMSTEHGRMYSIIDHDLLPDDHVSSDFNNLDFLGDCLEQIPVEDTYDKMVVINHIEDDAKRILVAVNIMQ